MSDSGKLREIKQLADELLNEGHSQSHPQKVGSICGKCNQGIVDDQPEFESAGKHYHADAKDCIP